VTRDGDKDDDRRAFLKTCGRFAAVTPPVMTLLLSTSLTSTAIARSGGLRSATRGDDRSQSFFDNDRSSGPAPGGSGGGGSVGGGSSSSSRSASSSIGGNSSGASGGGSSGGQGPFATGGNSGNPSAVGNVDCADEDDAARRRNPDCERPATRISSVTGSEH